MSSVLTQRFQVRNGELHPEFVEDEVQGSGEGENISDMIVTNRMVKSGDTSANLLGPQDQLPTPEENEVALQFLRTLTVLNDPALSIEQKAENVSWLLMQMQMAIANLRTQGNKTSSMEGVAQSFQIERVMKEVAEQLMKALEQAQKASEKSGLEKLLGIIIAAVVLVVTAVVATLVSIGTFGMGTPAMAMMMLGAVGAAMTLIDSSMKQAGHEGGVTMSALLMKAGVGIGKAMGKSDEDAEAFGKLFAGAVAVLMPATLVIDPSLAGLAAGGALEKMGVDKSAVGWVEMAVTIVTGIIIAVATGALVKDAIKTVQAAQKAAKEALEVAKTTGQTTAQVNGGVMSVEELTAYVAYLDKGIRNLMVAQRGQLVGGGIEAVLQTVKSINGIELAELELDASLTQADADALRAFMQQLEAAFTRLMAFRDSSDEGLEEVLAILSEAADAYGQSMIRMARDFGSTV